MRELLSDGNPAAPLLIYVGRLGSEKKIHRLTTVLDSNPTARLAIVGSGPSQDELKSVFASYSGRVKFTGPLFGDDLSAAYASADMFVMPSDSETLGFVVLEALASGIPSVGVAAGGLVDIIKDGEFGHLVENNDDMVEFSRQVGKLIEDPVGRLAMGAKACDWTQGFNWEAATNKLRNRQYRAAIALHRSRDERGVHVKDIEEAIMNNI
jgi:sulfoquinovosyltransferase